MLSVSIPTFIQQILGIDPAPLSTDAIYTQLSAACKRDYPACDSCLLTQDGVYAYFSRPETDISASVIVSVQRHGKPLANAIVLLSVTGGASANDLEVAFDLLDDAYKFSVYCRTRLRAWGRMS